MTTSDSTEKLITFPGLSTTARLVAIYIEHNTKRQHPECWLGTKRIATALGISLRAVQRAFRDLRQSGLIRVVVDYTKRTRRRLKLMWRDAKAMIESQLAFNFARAKGDKYVASDLSRPPIPPLEPPYKVSEDSFSETAKAVVVSEPGPPPLPALPIGEEKQAVEAAVNAFGPGIVPQARELIGDTSPAATRTAVAKAVRKASAGHTIEWGWVRNAAIGIHRVGHSGTFARKPEEPKVIVSFDQERERLCQHWEPIARTKHHPQRAIALAMLAKLEAIP